MSKQLSSAKLGEMPINKLVITMAGPLIVSMLVQALYNIVDSMFLGMSDTTGNALTALSLAFPWQNILISIAVGTGVGINALLSRYLGEKNYDGANKTASIGVLLAFLSWIAMVVLTFVLVEPFVNMQINSASSSDSQIVKDIGIISEYTKQYLYIVSGVSVGVFVQVCFERLLQATGKTALSMVVQLIGAGINIILDPIFIWKKGFGIGVFGMGVAGAAIATVIGQIVACIVAFLFNKYLNRDIRVSFKDMRPRADIIARIYRVGIPSVVMSSIGSIMTTGMNMIFMSIANGGKAATTIFGLYFKIISFVNMPVFGLNSALIPIISYNYGAKNKNRIIAALKVGTVYAMAIMVLGFIIFQAIPDVLIGIFNQPELIEPGSLALRITSIPFVCAGFCIIASASFQALDKSIYSVFVSVARQLLALLPVAYLFSLTGKVELVWWAFPIAEIISLLCCITFMFFVYKKKIKPLK